MEQCRRWSRAGTGAHGVMLRGAQEGTSTQGPMLCQGPGGNSTHGVMLCGSQPRIAGGVGDKRKRQPQRHGARGAGDAAGLRACSLRAEPGTGRLVPPRGKPSEASCNTQGGFISRLPEQLITAPLLLGHRLGRSATAATWDPRGHAQPWPLLPPAPRHVPGSCRMGTGFGPAAGQGRGALWEWGTRRFVSLPPRVLVPRPPQCGRASMPGSPWTGIKGWEVGGEL